MHGAGIRKTQHSIREAVMLLISIAALGCTESHNDYADLALNNDERRRLAKLQTLFKDTRERIGNVYLALDSGKIYRSREENGVIVAWDLVVLPLGGYPAFLTTGGTTTVEEWDGYLVFVICDSAIGAGGGCQRGGTFRTRDGVAWECKSGGASTRANSYPSGKEPFPWKPCVVEMSLAD